MIRDRVRRRRTARPEPAAAVNPLRDETAGYQALLRDTRNELSAARTSLAIERRKVLSLTDQVFAGRKLVAAAEQKCTESCAHARLVAEQRIQLAAMQERVDVLQAANERQESQGFLPRRPVLPYVPEQRQGQA